MSRVAFACYSSALGPFRREVDGLEEVLVIVYIMSCMSGTQALSILLLLLLPPLLLLLLR